MGEHGGELSRRGVLRGVAVAGVAAPIVAACGSTDSPPSAGGGPTADKSSSDPSGNGSAKAKATLAASDVPVGGGKILADQQVVVTQPTEGSFKAFSSVCTHQGCSVQTVAQGTIDCPCHGSMFSIKDGSVVQGPATSPLPAFKASLDGDQVRVS